MIKNLIRREDVIARYGGEEIAIILPEIDHDNALVFAEKIRRMVERTQFNFENTPLPITITISVDVATATADMTAPDERLRRSDKKLYEAKASGRNCSRGSRGRGPVEASRKFSGGGADGAERAASRRRPPFSGTAAAGRE